MRSSLSDTIWLSEKRKNLLLLLNEGPRDIDHIKSALNVTSKAMMPQIKILKEQNMVIQSDEDYELSDIGQILVHNMTPLLKTLDVIEENREYWSSRDLTPIPEELAFKLGELGQCMLIEPDLNHMFDLPLEFTENLKRSNAAMMFASYFHPLYPELFTEIATNKTKFDLMLTMSVLDRMKEECGEKLSTLKASETTNIYVCEDNDIKLTTIAVTEKFTYLCLFNKEGIYDHRKIITFDKSGIKWGKDLFDHYKQKAFEKNQIDPK